MQSTGSRNAVEEFSEGIHRLISDVNASVVEIVAEGFGAPEESSGGRTSVVGRQRREGIGVVVPRTAT